MTHFVVLKNKSRTDRCLICSRTWGSQFESKGKTRTTTHASRGLCRGCIRKATSESITPQPAFNHWSNDIIPLELESLITEASIDVTKLSHGSTQKIWHKCLVCQQPKQTPFNLFIKHKNLTHLECKSEKTKQTNLLKYQTKNPLNRPTIQQKKQLQVDTTIRKSLQQEQYQLINITRKSRKIVIEFKCPHNHIHTITSGAWWSGQRCGKCFGNNHKIDYEFVEKSFQQAGYQLLTKSYDNNMQKLEFICDKGHREETYWKIWTRGIRCSKCPKFSSKGEPELLQALQHYNPIKDRKVLKGKELDIYIPSKNLAIEYCGLYWHSDKHERIYPAYHYNKMELCRQNGIRLLTIFEDEWLDKQEICLSRIKQILGETTKKLNARDCQVREISKSEAISFLLHHHIDGCPPNFKTGFGLFLGGELVAVMTVGALSRAHVGKGIKTLELKRFATCLNTSIRGGASKLFKAVKNYAIQNDYRMIHTYCDMRWGSGKVYEKLGFQLVNTTKYTPLYTDGRVRWRNQKFANKNKDWSSLYKIYDCGHQSWNYQL